MHLAEELEATEKETWIAAVRRITMHLMLGLMLLLKEMESLASVITETQAKEAYVCVCVRPKAKQVPCSRQVKRY